MKDLKYKHTQYHLGGNALPDCGMIHITEVLPTLHYLDTVLEFPLSLADCTIGSLGKREYSGDIDIVINYGTNGINDYKQLHQYILDRINKDNVRIIGASVYIRVPIQSFNAEYNKYSPRTGMVQVDFSLGDLNLLKLYSYTCPDSEYKSLHRNISLSGICSVIDIEDSVTLDGFGRPVEQIRWKFNQQGLTRIRRTSSKNKDQWNKKQYDVVLSSPITDYSQIAKILFPIDGDISDLESLESVISAVSRCYSKEYSTRIFAGIYKKLSTTSDFELFEFPEVLCKAQVD